jgi:glucose-1-phosphate adenylyltransferase
VRNTLLFTGCRTHSFSALDHVVALPYVTVNRRARLKNCVIDRGVEIPEGLVVGEDPEEDARWFRRTEAGIVLITRKMIAARAAATG